MQKLKESWKIFLTYSSCVAIIAILILGGIFLSPSEPSSSLFLGLSLPRLILAAGLFIAFLFSIFLSIKALTDHRWAENTSEQWFGKSRLGVGITWFAGISFGLGWLGCFLPFYRAGVLAVHWERIRPVMVFILFASLATLVMAFLKRGNFAIQDLKLSKAYKSSLLLFFPVSLLIGIMLFTGFGVYAPEDYWYGAGVPILVSQLIGALMGGVLFLQAEKGWNFKRFDLVVFLFIFIVTAVLWAREPLQKSFLFIGPYAPNRVLYPFADAALFDTASQFALIGENFLFFNGQFFERAVYISFLVYLHSIIGQDYGQLMAAQAAVFAIFPALVYLIGKSLNMRAVGFAAAIVAALRGANSIAASNMIVMAYAKMMLTDFPTAIGMAMVVYLACEWLKKPQQKWYYALWIGGIVGLTIMLRTNTLLILLFIPLYSIFSFSPDGKSGLPVHCFLLCLFAITLPWELIIDLSAKCMTPFLPNFEA
jgi:4-amino-4-deoxy-L-arabinose transferase-like glycosyltransferase